jgi:hypothetical protein
MALLNRDIKFIFLLFALVVQALAQDISVAGAGGYATGEESRTRAVSAAGVSAGLPFASRHRIQFDYMFNNVPGAPENRHFVTGSYVVQGKKGRARPFFQVGAGVVQRHVQGYFTDAASNSTIWVDDRETSFAVLLGAGVTVEVWRSLFIRPQLRVYGHVGPTLTLLPGVAVGWHF